MPPDGAQSSDEVLGTLRPTSWAVLGLLSFGSELSGYDLKQWADWSLRFFYWSPSYSQIYSELRKLEELGLASSTVLDRDDLRGKRMYAITPRGLAAAAQWVNTSEVGPPVLKHSVMLRMWLGHLADPDRLRALLVAHRDRSEKMRRRAAADAEGAAEEPGWAYPELVLRWSEQYYAAERDRAEQMLADIEALSARAGRRPRTNRSEQVTRTSEELRRHRT